jgi:hypothetical protein
MEIRKKVIRVGKSVVKLTIDPIQTKRRDPNFTDSEKYQDASIFFKDRLWRQLKRHPQVLFMLVLDKPAFIYIDVGRSVWKVRIPLF